MTWQQKSIRLLLTEFKKFKTDKPLMHKDLMGYVEKSKKRPSGIIRTMGKGYKGVRKGKTEKARSDATKAVERGIAAQSKAHPEQQRKLWNAMAKKFQRNFEKAADKADKARGKKHNPLNPDKLKDDDKGEEWKNEVAPPGWGHTKAEKEKTKPSKPKSKIGGTIQAMKKAKAEGRMPGVDNIFALAWSMKNKGDKPHYKPGVRNVLKKKYKNETRTIPKNFIRDFGDLRRRQGDTDHERKDEAKKLDRKTKEKMDKLFAGLRSFNPSKDKPKKDDVDLFPTTKRKRKK